MDHFKCPEQRLNQGNKRGFLNCTFSELIIVDLREHFFKGYREFFTVLFKGLY